MRGNEPYKYEWGAKDEPIERLLVQRTVPSAGASRAIGTGEANGANGSTLMGGR
jgi:CelD/BcsL family acetyltransferase involved in cellulose biosynthesis